MMRTSIYCLVWFVICVIQLTVGQQHHNSQNSHTPSGGSSTEDYVSTPSAGSAERGDPSRSWHTIEGRVNAPDKKPTNEWLTQTQVIVNGGEHVGLLKDDGSFVIHGLPSGSFVVEVVSPQFTYESARIDITTKGKLRARKVNYIQPALVNHLPYPLKLNPTGAHRYFIPREQWRLADVLLSPMVLMMVLPLILIVILPKMMSDPETRREMEQVQLPKYEMPEMSEMLTSFFGGGSGGGAGDSGERRVRKAKAKKDN